MIKVIASMFVAPSVDARSEETEFPARNICRIKAFGIDLAHWTERFLSIFPGPTESDYQCRVEFTVKPFAVLSMTTCPLS